MRFRKPDFSPLESLFKIKKRKPEARLYTIHANDAGTSIGAAYYLWNQKLKNPRTKPINHSYLGPEYLSYARLKTLSIPLKEVK
ncbi:hypothetical protein MHK_004820 [Candidatus Magnetomorum sp. HK-1]|nr:hypothetical protein MHK_004820 [Candidatus Magnetomorum sp. HK-1]